MMKEFNDKIHDFRILLNNTVNSFHVFKNEYMLIKRKFYQPNLLKMYELGKILVEMLRKKK